MLFFWIGFHLFILGMVALDLKGFAKPGRGVIFWVALVLIFNVFISIFLGHDMALTFFTAYLVEFALSIDNIFVFILIFSFFGIEGIHRHKVLLWGVLGALFFRIVFILIGISLLNAFVWMNFVFGAILILSAFYLLKTSGVDIKNSYLFSLIKKCIPIDSGPHGGRFFIRKEGKLYVTTLFVCLLFLEATDVLFAVDSVPAVLAITKDPFLAYTSNVFAVLGLRSLYLSLAKLQDRFNYLKPAIVCILVFIGIKLIISPFVHIEDSLSLIVICFILLFFALFHTARKRK